jgi:hypothetical protein
VIGTHHAGQGHAKLVIMALPMVLRDQRPKAMASSRIPNGSMIGQFDSAAIPSKFEIISNLLFGMMSGRLVNQTRSGRGAELRG